jgi:cold shock protein
VSTRDRNFGPARRHSFDDDNYQPPTRDFGFASRPSILRLETPDGPPVRAIVKWYNPDKGFGFVELADGSGDAFLHVSVVERNGGSSVLPGGRPTEQDSNRWSPQRRPLRNRFAPASTLWQS